MDIEEIKVFFYQLPSFRRKETPIVQIEVSKEGDIVVVAVQGD